VFPGFLTSQLDFADFLTAHAPRPALMTTAIRDYFPIEGARSTFQEISRLFKVAGMESNAAYFEYDDTHGWSQPRREAMYRFLARHFQNKEDDGREPAATPEAPDLLNATPTGQLQTSIGSRTVFELNRELAASVHARRAMLQARTTQARRNVIQRALNLAAKPGAVLGLLERRSAQPGAPAVLEVVEQAAAAPAGGERTRWTLTPAALGAARPVRGEGGYTPDYQAAARGWLTGHSILATQVEDVLAAVEQLVAAKPKSIEIQAHGAAVPAALIAAALDGRVARITTGAPVPSWLEHTRTRLHTLSPLLVVPGVLAHFDFPDLAPLLAGRHVPAP
jgi:hypothetical protein